MLHLLPLGAEPCHGQCCLACRHGGHTGHCDAAHRNRLRGIISTCRTPGCTVRVQVGHTSCCSSCRKSIGAFHSAMCAGRQMIIAGSMPQAGAALPSALAFGAPSSDFAVDGPDEAMAGESPAAQGPAGDLPGHASSSTAGAGRVGSGNLANPASSSVQGNLAVFLSDSDEIMLPAVDNAGPVAAVQPADTTAADVDLSEMD